jgi:hypothetical protein
MSKSPARPTIDLKASSDTGSSSTDNITSDRTPTLNGTAAAGAKVTIKDGSKVLGAVTADKTGHWNFTTHTLDEGKHRLTAVTGSGHQQQTSGVLTLTADDTAPAKTAIDLAASSDNGSSSTDNITNDATPTLTGTAEKNATITIRDGSHVLGTATADKHGHWSFTSKALADGSHSLTAEVTDIAGNHSKASPPLHVGVDTSAPAQPTVDLDAASDTGSSSTDKLTSDTTPTLSGTAEAGAAITIKEGTTTLGTVMADGHGAWSFTTADLPEGTHHLNVTATDVAGNTSSTASLIVDIDTNAPGAPSVDLDATSDTGNSSTDHITNDAAPTLTGTAEAGAIVTIKDGTTTLGTVTADGSGAWSFTTTSLADGSHSLTAVAADAAGNASSGAVLALTIDTSAPDAPTIALDHLSDTGNSSTDSLTNDATPTLTGTAEAGAVVTIMDGATTLGTVTANDAGAWSFTATSLAEGNHRLSTFATDAAGNTGSGSLLVISVDTSAPGIYSIDLDTSSDNGLSVIDNITSVTTPTLSGTAEPGAIVTINDGATVLGTVTVGDSGAWSFTTGSLADGNRNLTAVATDAAGNTGSGAMLAVTIDTTAPAAPTIDLDASSDSGSSATDNITNDAMPTFSGKAEAGTTIAILDGQATVGNATADAAGNWSFTPSEFALGGGSHTLTVVATDAAGNVSVASALAITLDYTAAAPTIGLATASDTGGSATDDITSDTTPTLTGAAEAGAIVTITDGTTVLGTATADNTGAWSFTPASLADGSHSLTAVATDVAGNVSSPVSLAVTVDTSVAAPTIALANGYDSGSSQTDGITSSTAPFFFARAEAGATVTVMDGTTVLGVATATDLGTWGLILDNLAEGSHNITAYATDLAGNVSATTTYVLTIDTHSTMPTFSLASGSDTGSSSTDNITADATPTLNGTAEAGAIVTVRDGFTTLGTVTADASGAWSFTTSSLADGNHLLTASAVDVAGNNSPNGSLGITIDTSIAAPTIDLDTASDTGSSSTDNITSDTTPTLSGTAEAGTTVTIKDGTTLLATMTADVWGDWSFTTSSLADGDHNLTVVSTDKAGNTSSSTLAVTIDTQVAAPTINLDAGSDSGRSAIDDITSDLTPTLSGTAEAGATVTIKDGTTVLGTATADGTGAWSFTTGNLADGDHSLTAVATDAAGNSGTASTTLSITIDTQIAAPTIALATDDGTPGDKITTDPTLAGTAEAGATIAIFIDGSSTADGTVTADASGNWTYLPASLATGAHSFVVTEADKAGNAASDTFDMMLSSHLVFELSYLQQDQGFIAQTPLDNYNAGRSVHAAGDINGDGFDDLIIGVPMSYNSATNGGAAYVVFGSASGFGTAVDNGAGVSRQVIDLTSLSAAQGFMIHCETASAQVGLSVSSAGDVNGDGIDDLVVGTPFRSDGSTYSGEAYVVFGSTSGFGTTDIDGRQAIDLASLSAAQGFIIEGSVYQARTGRSVSSAGDINGDGIDDLIVGAPYGDDGGGNSGEAYVVFGSASGFGTTDGRGRQVIDPASLSTADGFVIQGGSGDYAGNSVSAAGDVNGDGFDDLIVGAPRHYGSYGAAYVVFGTASGFGTVVDNGSGVNRQVIDVRTISASQGFAIWGANSELANLSVSAAGDVNGDGFDDIIVGASYNNDGGRDAGSAYVVFGSAAGFGTPYLTGQSVIRPASLAASEGFVIQGSAQGSEAGLSVSSAGDVNGDGFDDLIIGAPVNYNSGDRAGEAYVVFGSASGFGTADAAGRQVIDLASLTASQGFVIEGENPNDRAGFSVSAAGDVNGDGFDDLIVGAFDNDDGGYNAGAAYVLYGSALGTLSTTISLTGTTAAETLIGGRGDDALSGGRGADVLIGGAGDDRLSIGDGTFARIRGGRGIDTLAVSGAGMNVDFTTIKDIRVKGIEHLDLTGTGDNTATLSASDVFHFSTVKDPHFSAATVENALVVLGNGGDVLNLDDTALGTTGTWTLSQSDVGLEGSAGGDYDIYEYKVSGTVRGFVAVDHDVTVHLI